MTLSNNGPLDAAEYIEPFDELEANLNALLSAELDEATAGQLNDCVKEIQALTKSADNDRKAIKEPHLVAGRQVDADFKPITERGKSLADKGKKAVTAYMIEQRRIADEARRKAEAEAAERARIAEELAKDALVGDMVKQEAEEAERAAEAAKAAAENSGRVGSLTGQSRVMSLRTSYEAVITDPIAAATFFADHPKVQDAIVQAANAMLRGKDKPESIAGMKINTIQKAA